MSNIPKIIHQTWKENTLPYPFDVLASTWKELHPDWKYQLWTDDMNRDFIKEHYPDFLSRYDSYPKKIQQVDAFRYFLLHKEGGLYVDVDFECLENVQPLLHNASCVIGKEPQLHCLRFAKEMILCNAFMAAIPGHRFMQSVCERVAGYPSIQVNTPIDVLDSTGPFILTDTFYDYRRKQDVKLLESSEIYPLTMQESKQVYNDMITDDMQQRIDKAYAVHYFWGNW